MKDILLYLLAHLVDHPEDVVVDEATEEGKTTLTAHIHPEDMGKVIGKSGRIIRAIRDLVKLVAAKNNAYVDVILAEQQ
ncbi:KH domain-containing protein [Candidatus Gottesmanbacteria bacterium]|nr:KH domain-containing protein [Candidatus Gottesmanbacteria bacterium]